MSRRIIGIFLALLGVAIVVIVLVDQRGSKPERKGKNPYAYDVEEYRTVDSSLILYKEIRSIELGESILPMAIDYYHGLIYLAVDSAWMTITAGGSQSGFYPLDDTPGVIHVAADGVYIGFRHQAARFNFDGELVLLFDSLGSGSVITSLVSNETDLLIADAGNRKIHRFSKEGTLLNAFEGKRNDQDLHGFIIPSPYFDVAISPDGELWAANTGMHSLENYTPEGTLRGYWVSSAITLEGFSGCCNPAHFDILPDGTFLTSEKGLVRIKLYKPSGELIGVVAGPDLFDGERAPEITFSPEGTIFALDFNRNAVRVFEKK